MINVRRNKVTSVFKPDSYNELRALGEIAEYVLFCLEFPVLWAWMDIIIALILTNTQSLRNHGISSSHALQIHGNTELRNPHKRSY